MRKWRCIHCGYIYDESMGCPEENIAPGSVWEDIAENWCCPDCAAGKEDFELLDE